MSVGTVAKGRVAETPPSGIARSRRVANVTWWVVCGIAMAFVVTPVVWILYSVFRNGVSGWRWSVLWTAQNGIAGGLANDIVGTLLITFGVAVFAGVVGVGCGIYLSEFTRRGPHRTVLRGAYEVLSGIPSIVFGYVGYVALDVGLHWQFSLLAAFIVLSMLVVPYIAKATELSLGQVPTAYREGGEALGMAKSYMLRRIVLRSALPGILTGLVIAIAISVGETAPLLYTAGASQYYPTGALIHSQVPYLTEIVYNDFDSTFPTQHVLLNDAAMLLVILVIVILLGSRLLVRATQKYAPNRAFAAAEGRRWWRRPAAANGAAALLEQAAGTQPSAPPPSSPESPGAPADQ